MRALQAIDQIETDGGFFCGPSADCLQKIARPDMALSVWRRALDPALQAWLDALKPEQLPHKRFVAARLMVPDVVKAACAELPDSPEKTMLVDDVSDLIDRFSDIVSATSLRVRLEAIDGDACRRFHQDAVEARLLCTYRGPATEWGYADPGEEPQDIKALQRGDAAICKGSAWRGAPSHRLVHRSPPIAGSGSLRLLLVVDPADPAEDQEWAAYQRPRRGRPPN